MAVVGEVASIIGLVQVGLALSNALIDYVGTVQEANEDVIGIAEDIQSTCNTLNDLKDVLKRNESTQVLTRDGLDMAARAVRQAETLLEKLRKLFTKGGGDPDAIEVDDIDISKIRKLRWYWYKSEFELRRTELHHIKNDVQMVYLSYIANAKDSSSSEKLDARNEFKLLYNKRKVLDKTLRKAKKKVRQRSTRDDEKSFIGSDYCSYYDDSGSSDGDEAITYATVDDLYQEFDHWLEEKQKKEQQELDEKKAIEDAAVERHEKELKEAREKVSVEAQKLREALSRHRIADTRIEQIVKDAYPQIVAQGFDSTSNSSPAPAPRTPVAPQQPKSKRWSWRTSRDASDITISDSIPDMLKDATKPGGVAQLRAIYFQRVAYGPEIQDIVTMEVAVPDHTFISRLLAQKLGAKGDSAMSSFLQGFDGIPQAYRARIARHMDYMRDEYDDDGQWTILLVQPIISQPTKGFSLRKRRADVVGVLVILRKTPPGDFYSVNSTAPTPGPGPSAEAVPTPRLGPEPKAPVRQSIAELDLEPRRAESVPRKRTSSKQRETDLLYSTNSTKPQPTRDYDSPDRERPHVSFADEPTTMPAGNTYPVDRKGEPYVRPPPMGLDLSRPTYIRCQRRYLAEETLDLYGLPWEYDQQDLDYIIIKAWIPYELQQELFEHTRRLRERDRRFNATSDGHVRIAEPWRSASRDSYGPPVRDYDRRYDGFSMPDNRNDMALETAAKDAKARHSSSAPTKGRPVRRPSNLDPVREESIIRRVASPRRGEMDEYITVHQRSRSSDRTKSREEAQKTWGPERYPSPPNRPVKDIQNLLEEKAALAVERGHRSSSRRHKSARRHPIPPKLLATSEEPSHAPPEETASISSNVEVVVEDDGSNMGMPKAKNDEEAMNMLFRKWTMPAVSDTPPQTSASAMPIHARVDSPDDDLEINSFHTFEVPANHSHGSPNPERRASRTPSDNDLISKAPDYGGRTSTPRARAGSTTSRRSYVISNNAPSDAGDSKRSSQFSSGSASLSRRFPPEVRQRFAEGRRNERHRAKREHSPNLEEER